MARFAILFSLLAVLDLSAAPLSLSQLQKNLSRNGAEWNAGENWVTQLTAQDQRVLLGATLPEGFGDSFSNRKEKVPARSSRAELDWRNYAGDNYVSPMMNQGRCGSCVAFAVIGALESQVNIARHTPSSPWAFSPQHLFSCGGGGCSSGWRPGNAMTVLKDTGVPDETCFPYTAGSKGEDIACSTACSDAGARSLKIADYTMPTWLFGSVDSVKTALQKGPLVTTMAVYEDFFYYKSGIYKHTTGSMAGGHAVSIVGYSDAGKYWIVRNSWGEDWGDKGFVKVSWDDSSGIGSQTWGMTVGEAEGYVTLGKLRDREIFRGKVAIKPETTVVGHPGIDVLVTNKDGSVLFPQAVGENRYSLDTTQHADGVYVLTASVPTGQKTLKSQPRTVYFLNGVATGAIKFTNLQEAQELKGAFVFEFDVEYKPVPFTKIVFKAKNSVTGAEIVRSTPNVANKMALNWRLADVEAGDYEVSLEGYAGDSKAVGSARVKIKVVKTSL